MTTSMTSRGAKRLRTVIQPLREIHGDFSLRRSRVIQRRIESDDLQAKPLICGDCWRVHAGRLEENMTRSAIACQRHDCREKGTSDAAATMLRRDIQVPDPQPAVPLLEPHRDEANELTRR